MLHSLVHGGGIGLILNDGFDIKLEVGPSFSVYISQLIRSAIKSHVGYFNGHAKCFM